MRPQHIAAENALKYGDFAPDYRASMRPQHIAAENARTLTYRDGRARGFNEAAAYRCGKLECVVSLFVVEVASMRPQHIAAENPNPAASPEILAELQ